MPRPNKPGTSYSEAGLARRIAFEREQRGMSLEGLAKRMTDLGRPIHASAIYKIEKGDPPRRITVDELVAFSSVFDLPVAELLLPPELVAETEVRALFDEWVLLCKESSVRHDAFRDVAARQEAAQSRLFSQAKESPALQDLLTEMIVESGVFGRTPDEMDRTADAFREAARMLEVMEKARAAQTTGRGTKRGKRQAKA